MEALILSLARNHLRRQRPLRIMIHQDESHPSHLELLITRGNIIGTFFPAENQLVRVVPLTGC